MGGSGRVLKRGSGERELQDGWGLGVSVLEGARVTEGRRVYVSGNKHLRLFLSLAVFAIFLEFNLFEWKLVVRCRGVQFKKKVYP